MRLMPTSPGALATVGTFRDRRVFRFPLLDVFVRRFLGVDHILARPVDGMQQLIKLEMHGFCVSVFWIRKTIRNVRMMVAVLIISCQVALNPSSGPEAIQNATRNTAPKNATGRPASAAAPRANRANPPSERSSFVIEVTLRGGGLQATEQTRT